MLEKAVTVPLAEETACGAACAEALSATKTAMADVNMMDTNV